MLIYFVLAKYLRINNVIGMCGSFNTLTSTDVTLTTSQEKLTQIRRRYVNDPPLNRFLSAPKARKNRRARQCTQRLKTFPTRTASLALFSAVFAVLLRESFSACVDSSDLNEAVERPATPIGAIARPSYPHVLFADLSKTLFPSADSGKTLIQLRTTTR